jgi:hypothetical protein
MGTIIAFPAERCSVGTSPAPDHRQDHRSGGSVIILPVIRVERQGDAPDGFEPSNTSPRGKRRKR